MTLTNNKLLLLYLFYKLLGSELLQIFASAKK
jgi:hypothetical protein